MDLAGSKADPGLFFGLLREYEASRWNNRFHCSHTPPRTRVFSDVPLSIAAVFVKRLS